MGFSYCHGFQLTGECGDSVNLSRIKTDLMKIALIDVKLFSLAAGMLLSILTTNAQVQIGADINGDSTYDALGFSVSMPDANTLAVGAVFTQNSKGYVKVYTFNDAAWIQKGVDIDGEAAGDWSGFSVSMADANTLAIGAPMNDGGGIDAGHVRVYTFTALDVSENSLSSLLKLYPNPTSNILNVEVGSEYLNSAYSIFENTGRVVLTGTLHSEVTSIQLGDLSSGVYTISVGDSIRQTFKVSRG